MTRIKKIGLSLTGLALLALGINYYFNPWPHTPMDPRFHAWKNPHPKQFLTLYGKIDPKIQKVILSVYYGTTNPKCDHYVSWIEGATGNYAISYDITLQPNQDGTYEQKIPIDKYEKGFCDWEPGDVSYLVLKSSDDGNGVSGLVFLSTKKEQQQNEKVFYRNVNCKIDYTDKIEDFYCDYGDMNFDFNRIFSAGSKIKVNFKVTKIIGEKHHV